MIMEVAAPGPPLRHDHDRPLAGWAPMGAARGSGGRSSGLEVAAAGLLALDRLEQGLEVALTEPLRTMPLDQLEEDGGPVLHWLGEDLQQIAVLVPVGEDPQFGEFGQWHAGLADPVAEAFVVGARRVEELHARRPHRPDGADRK